MFKNLLSCMVVLFLLSFTLEGYSNSREPVSKKQAMVKFQEGVSYPVSTQFNSSSITLEGQRSGFDYVIRPEVQTTISGYYDWQTNGQNPNFVNYVSPTMIHAIEMVALDSADINGSRRTGYSFSSDGGATWSVMTTVPNIRSGFPSLTVGTTGASQDLAIVGNHYQPGALLLTGLFVDAFPGLGSFTSYPYDGGVSNFIWPNLSTLSNGDVMVAAETYQGGAATDTGYVTTFNPNTNTWSSSSSLFLSSASSQLSMRWAGATGPGGKAIYVLDALSDVGNSIGQNRIFYYTSEDNGATWSTENVVFDSFIDGTDTITAWLGLDAVYDNAGNHYIVFNALHSVDNGNAFVPEDSRIYVSKNGAAPVLVAEANQNPVFTDSIAATMGNACGMDWPTIGVSADGQHVFVGYSVMTNDIVNGFNSYDLYYHSSPTSTLDFSEPRMITSGPDDERYISFNNTTMMDGSSNEIMPMTYMKDPQPGSCAFNDNAPISRNYLIYREIENPAVGISNISGEIPGTFKLSQNYPNPFNPTTSIRFEIPTRANVTLKVFDLSGREVATLLNNQSLTAGIKEFNFNGETLGSGVYFYTLQAGDFKETKKMVLLK